MNRSSYCEFELFFRQDVALALNTSIDRVRLLLIKAASLDDVLVYLRLLPPGRFGLNATTSPNLLGPESPSSYLIADLSEQTQRLSSRLYGGTYFLLRSTS